jgi:hypothetical protein
MTEKQTIKTEGQHPTAVTVAQLHFQEKIRFKCEKNDLIKSLLSLLVFDLCFSE